MKINIEAKISSELDTVFNAFTNPEHIVNWNFASDDWCCPSASVDLREGGVYSARMEAKDGSFGFDFEAVYTKVEKPELIEFKMADDRIVTVSFIKLVDGILVNETFDAETQNPPEMQKQGWQSILNNFKKYIETQL